MTGFRQRYYHSEWLVLRARSETEGELLLGGGVRITAETSAF